MNDFQRVAEENSRNAPYKRPETPELADFEERGTEAQVAALYAALASAQGEFTPISREKEVFVKSDKGSYKFQYAPLEVLIVNTRPALSKHGLCVLTPLGGSVAELATQRLIIAHKDGGRIVFTYTFYALKDMKQFGGQITYLRRYSYAASLGLAADGDLDDMPMATNGESSVEVTRDNNQRRNAQPPDRAPDTEQRRPSREEQTTRHAPGPTTNGQSQQRTSHGAHGGGQQRPDTNARDVSNDSGEPTINEVQRTEIIAKMRSLNYTTGKAMSQRCFKAKGGDIFPIGNEPMFSKMSVGNFDLVMEDLISEGVDKSIAGKQTQQGQ